METAFVLKPNSSSSQFIVPGTSKLGGRNLDARYDHVRIQNEITGKREYLVLFDPQNEANDALLAAKYPIELRVDLKKALASFTRNQQLIIVRVLLHGYTFQQATKRMRISYVSAWRWFTRTAIPQLQAALIDYKSELHEVLYNPAILPETPPAPERHSAKCKFCTNTFTSYSNRIVINKLKKHIKAEHPEQFVAARKHICAKDYENHSFEISMFEDRKEIRNED
jgi:hypothetical protein